MNSFIKSIQSLRRIGQQEQEIGEDIAGVGLPYHVEQKASQHCNHSHIERQFGGITPLLGAAPQNQQTDQGTTVDQQLVDVAVVDEGA